MGKHASAGRELDESFRGFREALMVASEATPTGNPGDAAFDHPSSGKDLEAALGRLGLWLGLPGTDIGGGAQTLHGLNVPSEILFYPLKKLPPVMTIAPNELQPGKATLQWLKELLASRQVGIAGCCHLDFHQIALGINEQVSF